MQSGRTCPRCGKTKGLSQFNWKDSTHRRQQSYCRDCSNAAWREWYSKAANRRRHLAKLAERRHRRHRRHQELVTQLKSQPCADCGLSFPSYVMDFDHVESKTGEVSSFVYTYGTARLLAEIQRCEVVCANCHRMRTEARARKG